MSGGNGIPRYAQWNRENELAPLRFRGIIFRNFNSLTVLAPLTLTPDQVMNHLTVFVGGTVTWPSVASVLGNPSSQGLLSQYLNTAGSGFETTITNLSGTNVTITFPSLDYFVSPTFNLTIVPGETRTIRYRVLGSNTIYVY